MIGINYFGYDKLHGFSMKLLVLSCLAALAFNSGAEDKVNLCGSELARARVMLCYGAEYLFKRSANGLFDC